MMKVCMKVLVMVLGFWSLNVNAELNIVVLDSVRAILESDEAKVLVEAANTEMEEEANELVNNFDRQLDAQWENALLEVPLPPRALGENGFLHARLKCEE